MKYMKNNIRQKKYLVILVLIILFVYLYFKSSAILDYIEYYFNYYFYYYNITLGSSPSKNVLLFSNSSMGGGNHLMYALPILKRFFEPFNIKEILLIPYSYPDIRDGIDTHSLTKYLPKIQETFKQLNINIRLLDPSLPPKDQQNIISNAQAIYVMGGNTFALLKAIYDNDVLSIIKEKINKGVPIIGVSAGTVIHGPTIKTTNDMPILYPKSIESLNTVPFQINTHYNNTFIYGFQGETRDMRLKEYLQYNRTMPGKNHLPNFVVGLKEGTVLHISGNQAELAGFGTRPAVHLQLDINDDLVRKTINIGSRIDNLFNV